MIGYLYQYLYFASAFWKHFVYAIALVAMVPYPITAGGCGHSKLGQSNTSESQNRIAKLRNKGKKNLWCEYSITGHSAFTYLFFA
eukprot:scaffold703_cov168-Amphora_coffeaeformis.AAC.3